VTLREARDVAGSYDALMRCADKSTVSQWRGAIEVMGAMAGFDIKTTSPWLPPMLWRCLRCSTTILTREVGPRCPRCGFVEGT
jgi:hypothetical protein